MIIPDPVIIHSAGGEAADEPQSYGSSPSTLSELEKTVGESLPQVRVGIWDLGARLHVLRRIIESLNKVQNSFAFVEILAAVPTGLVSKPDRVARWASRHGSQWSAYWHRYNPTELLGETMKSNVIANDFFPFAEKVCEGTEASFIVGLTRQMVAGINEDGAYWNHFSTWEGRTILASTYELREFASESGRSVEAFVAWIILAQLLVAIEESNKETDLRFHEDRGCLFDYNADRRSLISCVQEARIEPDCLEQIPPVYHEAVLAMVEAIKKL